MLEKVLNINKTLFSFEHFEEVNPYFKKIINVLKQMNYSEFESEQFKKFEKELEEILNEKAVVETEQP
jgi:V/A-type H+-transporting ATPase subunit A